MKRIFIHIGAPKTGTSSIQDFCRNNVGSLAARGLWYPLLDVQTKRMTGRYRQPAAHHLLADALRPHSAKRMRRKDTSDGIDVFERVLSDFAASSHPDMLLSAETFFQHARRFVCARAPAMLSGFELIVICYVRRADEFVESLYKTVIKGHERYTASIEQFAQTRAPRYPDRLAAFLDVVPANNVILRSYDEQRERLLEDFLAIVLRGVDDELRGLFPEYKRNISIGAKQTLFLRHLNRCAVSLEDFVQVRRAFRSARFAKDDASLMPPELRHQLITTYREEVATLKVVYGTALPIVEHRAHTAAVIDTMDAADVSGFLEGLREHLKKETWIRLREHCKDTGANSINLPA